MKRAIIFDLDNCLAPATCVGQELYEPAFHAIRKSNRGTLPDHVLQDALRDIWTHPLDWVAEHYGFSQEMFTAAWNIFKTLQVERPLRGYDDLDILSELAVQRFLVTSGFRRLQESKIAALGLQHKFAAVFIDAIDEQARQGKRGLFQRILATYCLQPAEVLVVGDNPRSEIEAGNQLGIETVQTLRPGVALAGNASYHVRSLVELKGLLDGRHS